MLAFGISRLLRAESLFLEKYKDEKALQPQKGVSGNASWQIAQKGFAYCRFVYEPDRLRFRFQACGKAAGKRPIRSCSRAPDATKRAVCVEEISQRNFEKGRSEGEEEMEEK